MTEEITIRQTESETASAVPTGQASTEVPTAGARVSAERGETTNRKPTVSWAALLDEAVSKPGFIHQAYSRFHNYSLGNQLLALFQCFEREITPGPLASFMKWKQVGRRVKKGERALTLCMPLSCTRTRTVKRDDGSEQDEQFTYTHFTYKNHWFVLSQTEGAEYQASAIPEWNEENALAALNIERIPFENLDGNTQGYARRGGKIAINPLAALPHKTFFHEAAHCLLHCQEADLTDTDQTPRSVAEVEAEAVALLCCESLGLPGAEFSRGYIQAWAKGEAISERSAQRIFHAADRILKAGYSDSHALAGGELTMRIGERVDQENPQHCLICGETVSVARDWPVCPACKFNQTSPEAYAIRKASGLLWRSGLTETDAAADSFPNNQPSNDRRDAGQPLFSLGQIVATPGALSAIDRANQSPAEFVRRHVTGDWGELDSHDIAENEYSLTHGFRLLSSYRTTTGETLWVITEADRSVTTLLLPEEY